MTGSQARAAHLPCTTTMAGDLRRRELRSFSGRLGIASGTVMPDPDGCFFDIGRNDEGVLDLRRGACRDGRKRFQVSIRDDALIVFSLKQARRRKKAARR